MRGAIYFLVGKGGSRSRRCHLHCVAKKVLSATRLSVLRTHGRVALFTRHANHVLSVIGTLFCRGGRSTFLGACDHMRGCRDVDSQVRVRVTGCLAYITRNHLDSRKGRRVHVVLHTMSRVRDVTSSYGGVTQDVGHHGRFGSVFASRRGRGISRVLTLARGTLRHVVRVLGGSRLMHSSIGPSCGVRGRVGGCHGRLGVRGIRSVGGGGCRCRSNICCVSVVNRTRGLNSCMLGMMRTIVRGGVW